jgi:hypothetical protein
MLATLGKITAVRRLGQSAGNGFSIYFLGEEISVDNIKPVQI